MLKHCSLFLLILTSLLLQSRLFAGHIIGGEVTYECLGTGAQPNTNRYQFRMEVYRDCTSNAVLDSAPNSGFNATLSVYASPDSFVAVFDILSLEATFVDARGNACAKVDDNICVERGIYTFPVVELERLDRSYYVAYQRCCRNASVQNLIQPDRTGGTYFVEITPEAQSLCNSSPQFKQLAPIAICVGEQLDFDFSAADADGNRLEYSLCSPLKGGGIQTDINNVNNPDGLAPIPATAPDYEVVSFVEGFDAQNPLGSTANIQIDAETGRLTGFPRILGQFALAVCVREYDAQNRLLSEVRRDFQFNVVPCSPLVEARIAAPLVDGTTNNYFVQSCGDLSIELQNESVDRDDILEVLWTFPAGDSSIEVTTWDANLEFAESGTFNGFLIVNPNELCKDTAFIEVQISPTLQADFRFDYDTCSATPVVFEDLSIAEATNVERIWRLGDGTTSSSQDLSHLYDVPGTYEVALLLNDENGCSDSFTQTVDYYPRTQIIDIVPDKEQVCLPDVVQFDNFSEPLSEAYTVNWSFGDGNSTTAIRAKHEYTTTGIYDVSVEIVSPTGCRNTRTFPNLIRVDETPIADFNYRADVLSSVNPEVAFFDNSRDATSVNWDFGDGTTSFLNNPIHSFRDTGMFQVLLIAKNQAGCTDSLTRLIDVVPDSRYFLPNAFTPNGDGVNDTFVGKGQLGNLFNFSMSIYNRYGELVFFSDDPMLAWDGRKRDSNSFMPQGVYVYAVEYFTARNEQQTLTGTVMLLR